MHEQLLKEISFEKLRSFMEKSFDEIKRKDYDMYEELELDLYKEMYGCHFSEWLLEKALCKMENADGSKGKHWTLADTTQVAKSSNVSFDGFNEYDWCYVMNMMYSDYCGVFGSDANTYVMLAKAFLEDDDAPKGKAFKYYYAMRK